MTAPSQAESLTDPQAALSSIRAAHRAAGGGSKGAQVAEPPLREALRRWPGDVELRHAMAQVLLELGRSSEGVREARRAVEAAPKNTRFLRTLGALLRQGDEHDKAERVYRKAAELEPASVIALDDHAACLRHIGRPAAAASVLERAVALQPSSALRVRLAQTSGEIGRAELSLAPLRRAVAETEPGAPEGIEARTAYASQLVCVADTDPSAPATPSDMRSAHEAWAQGARTLAHRVGTAKGLAPMDATPSARADGRIRVGYCSWDFRKHSVAYFLEPLLEAHDRDRVEVVCYATGPVGCEVSERFQALADRWRVTPLPRERIGHEAPAYRAWLESVRADDLDVLVETGGHTVGSALPALAAARAAPMQMSYCGYAATTGLDAIDARLVDRVTDTPEAQAWHTERLLRLDRCFLCYRPPSHAPVVAPAPMESNGFVTFGSFNRPAKLTERTIGLWARAIAPIAGARLLLKGQAYAEESVQRSVRARFELAGLDGERVEFLGRNASTAAHLETYARVDIALDTLPYNGTTTTCEALWMGAPVLTRMGGVHAARVSASILKSVGLEEMVATDDEAFIERAAALADDASRLHRWRSSLRDRMRASALMDARSLAGAVEDAFEHAIAGLGETGGERVSRAA
ncbi:MAG: hypothetical protein AAGK04_00270 [Planctomycetota bacterium]